MSCSPHLFCREVRGEISLLPHKQREARSCVSCRYMNGVCCGIWAARRVGCLRKRQEVQLRQLLLMGDQERTFSTPCVMVVDQSRSSPLLWPSLPGSLRLGSRNPQHLRGPRLLILLCFLSHQQPGGMYFHEDVSASFVPCAHHPGICSDLLFAYLAQRSSCPGL